MQSSHFSSPDNVGFRHAPISYDSDNAHTQFTPVRHSGAVGNPEDGTCAREACAGMTSKQGRGGPSPPRVTAQCARTITCSSAGENATATAADRPAAAFNTSSGVFGVSFVFMAMFLQKVSAAIAKRRCIQYRLTHQNHHSMFSMRVCVAFMRLLETPEEASRSCRMTLRYV
jgi:hypothetical protein